MKTPVALFTADQDWLADPYDIDNNLRPYLKDIVFSKNMKSWNHMDFVWGESAYKVVYKDLIDLMEK